MEFFVEKGMSIHSKKISDQVKQGKTLLYNDEIRENMLDNQRKNAKKSATRDIINLMSTLIKKKDN